MRLEEYAPGRIKLSTFGLGPTLLMVHQSFVPGWHVEVDHERATPYPAGGLFFAVPLPPSLHRVTLAYRVPGLCTGFSMASAWCAGAAAGSRDDESALDVDWASASSVP